MLERTDTIFWHSAPVSAWNEFRHKNDQELIVATHRIPVRDADHKRTVSLTDIDNTSPQSDWNQTQWR